MVGHVGQLGLKLLRGFFKLILRPQQIAEAKVDVGLPGIGFHRGAKLLDGGPVILHLVFCLARQHVGFGRFGVQGEDLAIHIEDTLELPR